jgi:meso-butanediol dehydrogenase / (S,S)-butanediol dehydrogenase / diacetyl reductase
MTDTRRLAVVTGAGSGIGAAISRRLGREGYAVAATDLDEQAARRVAGEIAEAGGEADAWLLDVTDQSSVETALDAAIEGFGPLAAWVSNAGISSMRPFVKLTQEDWDSNLGVNAKGVFLCGQVAARQFIDQGGGGAIVNLASMAGKRGAAPYLAHYVASKFAVVGLTQAMALELAPHGIRVNSVCPGYVATAMQERELAWEAELRGTTPGAVREEWVADTPMGRLEVPEDVAGVVAFLVGPDAAFMTGEAIAVNGGAHMD